MPLLTGVAEKEGIGNYLDIIEVTKYMCTLNKITLECLEFLPWLVEKYPNPINIDICTITPTSEFFS